MSTLKYMIMGGLLLFYSAVFAATPWVYTSVQSNNPTTSSAFVIPNKTWTTVPYYVKRNTIDGGWYVGGASVPMPHEGFYMISTALRWQWHNKGQRIMRFVRNGNDITGSDDTNATAGKDYITEVWPSFMREGSDISVQVYQSSGGPLRLEFAQLKVFLVRNK